MMEYYPTLIEAAVEFRIHSRFLLAQREGRYNFEILSNYKHRKILRNSPGT